MGKKVWRTEKIENSTSIKINDVYQVTLNNYSAEDITFQNNGVNRVLPKLSALGTPTPFEIDIRDSFDLDIKVNFPSGQGVLIIDYTVLKQC